MGSSKTGKLAEALQGDVEEQKNRRTEVPTKKTCEKTLEDFALKLAELLPWFFVFFMCSLVIVAGMMGYEKKKLDVYVMAVVMFLQVLLILVGKIMMGDKKQAKMGDKMRNKAGKKIGDKMEDKMKNKAGEKMGDNMEDKIGDKAGEKMDEENSGGLVGPAFAYRVTWLLFSLILLVLLGLEGCKLAFGEHDAPEMLFGTLVNAYILVMGSASLSVIFLHILLARFEVYEKGKEVLSNQGSTNCS